MTAHVSWRWLLAAFLLYGWNHVRPASAAGAPLYEARWDGGLSGWQVLGDPGWSVSGGVPGYGNRTAAADLIAPYRAGAHRDFVVEAQIERIGGRGKSLAYAEPGYGVFVRGSGRQEDAVTGGFFFGDVNGDGFYPQSGLDWNGSLLRGADTALHDGFNTFRLEVHGGHYALYENGALTVQATVTGFRGDRIGVFSRQYRIRVRSFRVLALPARSLAGGPPSALLGKLAALDLQPKEAPSGFRKSFGEYVTNQEIAVERKETVDALRQTGRLLSYQVEYRQLLDRSHPEKGEKAIDATVAAFSSVAGARADFDYVRAQYSSQRFRFSAPGKYGTDDFLAVYDSPYRGRQYTNYDLLFVRGSYRAAVSISFVKGTVPPFQALQWLDCTARTIDSRLS